MKNNIKVFTVLLLGVFLSCNKHNTYKTGVLVKNCTGSYVRIDNKDYLICNSSVVENLNPKTEIKIKYELIDKIEECNSHEMVCFMIYPHEANIFITKIKS